LVEIKATVDEKVWQALLDLARETGRKASDLLNEAIFDFVGRRRRQRRSTVMRHLDDSIRANRQLGRRLAR